MDQLLEDTANDIKRPLEEHKKDLEDAVKYDPKSRTHLSQAKPMPENIPTPKKTNEAEVDDETGSDLD